MVHTASLTVAPLSEAFDELLGASVHLRAVGLLVTLPDKEFTGREIAALLRVSHSNVQRALRTLVDLGFVSKKRIGRADVITVNKDHFAFPALRAMFLLKRELPDRVLADLRSAFRGSAISVTVFGSYARGEPDRESDLDVLVVTKDPSALKGNVAKIEVTFARKYGVPLSVKLLSPGDLKGGPIAEYIRTASDEGVLVLGTPLGKLIGPDE